MPLWRSDQRRIADDVVSQAQTHAKETHDMEMSQEQAESMARPA